MPKDFTKLLTSLGLSGSETRVYLASLKLGPNSVQEIAKKARLSRTATYDAIKSLQDHGLISTYETGKKRYFAAEDPEHAVAHFRDEINSMNKQLEALNRALPEFKMIAGGERPSVRFYEGKEAIFAAFHDVSKVRPKDMLEVTNYDDVHEFLDPDVLTEARKLLNPKTTQFNILYQGELKARRKGWEYCQMLPGLIEVHGDIWIYDGRIVFITFVGKPTAVIIESKAFADLGRALFKAAWKSSEAAGGIKVGKKVEIIE